MAPPVRTTSAAMAAEQKGACVQGEMGGVISFKAAWINRALQSFLNGRVKGSVDTEAQAVHG